MVEKPLKNSKFIVFMVICSTNISIYYFFIFVALKCSVVISFSIFLFVFIKRWSKHVLFILISLCNTNLSQLTKVKTY